MKTNVDHAHDLNLHTIFKSICGPSLHNAPQIDMKTNVDHAHDLNLHTIFKGIRGPSLHNTPQKLI